MKLALLVIALALASSPAFAGAWSKGCEFSGGNVTGTIGTSVNGNTRISNNEVGCYRFNNADGVHRSTRITVTAASATILVDYDTGAAGGASVARVTIRQCGKAPVDTANPHFSCIGVTGSLDGTEGAPTGVAASPGISGLAPGNYVFDVTVACPANETCQVMVIGAGPDAL